MSVFLYTEWITPPCPPANKFLVSKITIHIFLRFYEITIITLVVLGITGQCINACYKCFIELKIVHNSLTCYQTKIWLFCNSSIKLYDVLVT